jgi:hypothetical protein
MRKIALVASGLTVIAIAATAVAASRNGGTEPQPGRPLHLKPLTSSANRVELAPMEIDGTVQDVSSFHAINDSGKVRSQHRANAAHQKRIDKNILSVVYTIKVDRCLKGECPASLNTIIDTSAGPAFKITEEDRASIVGRQFHLYLQPSRYFAEGYYVIAGGEELAG